MKRIISIIVVMVCCLACRSDVNLDDLPEAKPGDRLFIKDGFLRTSEVKLPAPKTIAQAEHQAKIDEIVAESKLRISDAEQKAKNTQELYESGRFWFGWGLFALIIGAALTFYLKAYQLSFVGALIAIGGIGATGRGAWAMQVAGKPWIITVGCIGIAVFVGASFMLKDEGIEFGKMFKGKD